MDLAVWVLNNQAGSNVVVFSRQEGGECERK